jgi:hypothetical protein
MKLLSVADSPVLVELTNVEQVFQQLEQSCKNKNDDTIGNDNINGHVHENAYVNENAHANANVNENAHEYANVNENAHENDNTNVNARKRRKIAHGDKWKRNENKMK